MKKMNKMILISMVFAGLFSCADANGNSSKNSVEDNSDKAGIVDNGNGSKNSVEKKSDKAAIVANIKANAFSSDYGIYIVYTSYSTDANTFLAYYAEDDSFGVGAYSKYENLSSVLAVAFDYMDLANASGGYTISKYSTDVFKATIYSVEVSNHVATNYRYRITIGDDAINDSGVKLMTSMFNLALSNCNSYLSAYNLSYIY